MEKVQKILTYLIFVVAAVAAYFWVSLAMNEEAGADDVSSFYILTAVMLGVAVGVTLLSTLIQMLTNVKQLKQALVALVIFGVIGGISYSLASNAEMVWLGETIASSTESKVVGTGMYATYIIGAIAILSIVLAPVFKLIRK
jgi:hypothetical protein